MLLWQSRTLLRHCCWCGRGFMHETTAIGGGRSLPQNFQLPNRILRTNRFFSSYLFFCLWLSYDRLSWPSVSFLAHAKYSPSYNLHSIILPMLRPPWPARFVYLSFFPLGWVLKMLLMAFSWKLETILALVQRTIHYNLLVVSKFGVLHTVLFLLPLAELKLLKRTEWYL